MTNYCQVGDKPKVFFRFNGEEGQIYEPKFSPVNVEVENVSGGTPNYKIEGYQLNFYSTNNRAWFNPTGRDYWVTEDNTTEEKLRKIINILPCDDDTHILSYNFDPSTLTINPAIHCPIPKPAKKKAKLHIKKSGQTVDVFTVEGEAPCTFNVGCERCPPGTCECKSDNYPGYCCVDCPSVASSIRAITDELRSKNGG